MAKYHDRVINVDTDYVIGSVFEVSVVFMVCVCVCVRCWCC